MASFLAAACARITTAAEPVGLRLIAPDSLIGWTDGPTPPTGWTVMAGALTGNAEATPLQAGWTIGDFELRLSWTVSPGGSIKLTFPSAPPLKNRIADPYITPEFHLVLAEGDGAAQLWDGPRLIASSQKPINQRKPVENPHRAVIHRQGEKLSLVIDEQPAFEAPLESTARLGLRLSVPEGTATLQDLELIEPAGDALFNGHDLSGWTTSDPPEAWIVEDNQIVCTGKGRDYLRTARPYDNFTLTFEYNLSRRGNSGIGIRTAVEGWPSGDGMELQLYDESPQTPVNRHSTMAIYGNLEPLVHVERPGQWNRAVIKAEGYVISAWVNGVLAQHANTFWLPELRHRNLTGWVGLQNHHSPIRFRNLHLLPGGPGRGMADWYAPRPETAAQAVLDRVMNSERLSRQDGLTSGSIAKSVAAAGSHTLAELTGPGALLEIAGSGDPKRAANTQLALYFDGEAKPRIRSTLYDLWRKVPSLAEGGDPTLMFLGYQRQLRIVAETKGPVDFRIDYVHTPGSLELTTDAVKNDGIARGLLPAISYRLDQMDGGRHRELDPYPRMGGEAKTIEPGKTVELLSVAGSGLVDFLKLRVAPEVLSKDGLWVHVTIDGESQPAISAPARFLFPGLAENRDWHNFVLVNREGATLRLAMPFSVGLTITASNQGLSPITDVAAVASVIPADQAPGGIAQRGRLRGVLSPAESVVGSARPNELTIRGRGRWIGLVTETGANPQDVSIDWRVDDSPAGNSRQSLASFLGTGATGEIRKPLSGHVGKLAWRYLLLAPIEYQRSFTLNLSSNAPANRALALFYATTE